MNDIGAAQTHLILVVDDDQGMRRAMSRLLAAAGYAVHAFDSADEAVASGQIDQADCLVIDVHLAGRVGISWYASLDARRPPAVFVTAFDSAEVRGATLQAGASSCLTKPFEGRLLIDAVSAAVLGAPRGN